MENITRFILIDFALNARTRFTLTYLSILMFIGFAAFATFSVKNYVSNTLSISLVEAEVPLNNSDETLLEESSVNIFVKNGDTLKTILVKQELPSSDILQIIKIAEEQEITSSLKIGQQITFDYELKILENDNEDLAAETLTLNRVVISLDKLKTLEITRENGDFVAKTTIVPLNRFISKSSVVIESNFMAALKSLGLSTNSIMEL